MTTSTQPIRVKHIDHVTLIVNDLEKSREFYCDVLGMEQVDRPGFSFGGRWFQAGATQIHLIHEHDNSGPAGENTTDLKKSSRNRHFAFEIENGETAVARLSELNVPLLAGPQTRPDGAVQLFVVDPDGHVVELCSPPVAAEE
jgi:catechol 2,3-dioxygenase-like lactoylglutathione lyase family enzyme